MGDKGAKCNTVARGAHMQSHMTPAQAGIAVGVSRWAVMRAIKALSLHAVRDNRGIWRIAPDDLADWATHRAHTVRLDVPHSVEPQGLREALAVAVTERDALAQALARSEVDRDHWRSIAQTLAARRRWWPF